jgi:hypothetical protein
MAATDYAAVVQQLYISYFGRPADTYALQAFTAQLAAADTTGTLVTTPLLSAYAQANPTSAVGKLVASFAGKPEAVALYGTGTDILSISKFVNAIYQNVLHRDADTEGGTYWINAIVSGGVSKENAALAITEGALGNTTPQGLLDAALVAKTNAVAIDFTTSLDTIPKINAYSGDAAAAAIRDLLKTVTATTVVADFHASVATAITALTQPPSVVASLTEAVDTVVGTGANDVFNGTNKTFGALDKIDGAGGTNTLNLVDTAGSIDLSVATVTNIQKLNVQSIGGVASNAADVSGWAGLTDAKFTLKSASSQTITAADTTAVTVSNTAGATVVGGSSVSVTTGSAAAAIALNAAANGAAGTTLTTALGAAATLADVQAATAAAVTAGALTAAQKIVIDTAGVAGGSAAFVTIQAADTAAVAAYNVTATSNAALASASVKGGNTVAITDGSTAGTVLKSVSLDGNLGAATLIGNGLVAVNLANTSASTGITNTAAHTQTLTLTNVKGGTITDAGATAVVVNTATTKSSAVSLAAAAATKVTVNSAVDLTLADVAANLATSIAITGAGKTTISGLSAVGALVSIDATAAAGGVTITPTLAVGVAYAGGAGKDSISIGATTKALTTGAGDDTVTVTAALGTGGQVDAGAGTDTLAGTITNLTTAASTASKFANFETLKVTDVLTNGASVDVSAFVGVVNFNAGAGVANTATASAVGLGANANVTLAGNLITNNGTLILTPKTDTATDVINLTVNHSYLDNNDTTADPVAVTATITATGIETLNVNSTATNTLTADTIAGYKADVVTNTLALSDDAIVTLKVTGDRAFAFTAANTETKLATIDASANTGGVNINASATVAGSAALTIKGSATAANTLVGGATVDTIVGGTKADTITGGANGDTLTGAGGNDTFKFAAGDSSIGTGKFDTITDFVANAYGNSVTVAGAAGTGAGTDPTKWTGDVLNFTHIGTVVAANGVVVDVLGSAADASTYLANHAGSHTVIAALDSANNNLYVDVTDDGVADFYIHLTGVTTITAAAFTVA